MTPEAPSDWLPLDQALRYPELSPPRDWSSRAPVLIGFDAASVARLYPTLDRVIVGRMGSDRPRGCRSEIGLRLEPQEWFFHRDDDPKIPAGFRLPRLRFRRCHGSCGVVAGVRVHAGGAPRDRGVPRECIQHLPPGRRPRIDGPMGPHYQGSLVRPLSDLPDPPATTELKEAA